MKRRIIAFFAAAAMAVSLLPTVSFAKTAEVTPILRYTFDGDNALASENGGNALTLNGGAEITDEGNVGKG